MDLGFHANGTPGRRSAGFSLVELVVVLVVVSVMLAIAGTRFTDWRDRASARRAGQVFARDLSMARATSARGRERVVVRFYEGSLWYSVTTESGREMARRRFGPEEEVFLSAIDLQFPGDSVVFNARGIADLSGVGGALGEARFTAGQVVYQVAFNSLGASRVGEL